MATHRAIGGIGRGAPVQTAALGVPGGMNNGGDFGSGGFGNANSGFGGGNQSSGFGQGGNLGGDSGFGSMNAMTANRGNSSACRKCGEEGHFSRECPNSESGGFGGNDGNSGGFGGGGGRSGNRTCNKCNQEGHIARNCPNTDGAGGFGGGGFGSGGFGGGGGDTEDRPRGRGRGCYNCGEEGHISKDCTQPRKPRNEGSGGGFISEGGGFGSGSGGFGNGANADGGFGGGGFGGVSGNRGPKTCRSCGVEGHIGRDCPNRDGGGGAGFGGGFGGGEGESQDRNRNCYNCGGEGHMSKDCTEPRKERGPSKCFRCNEDGHLSKDCPNPPAEGAENRKAVTYEPEVTSVDNLWQDHIAAGINFDRYYNIPVEITGNDIVRFKQPIRSFADAGLTPLLLENVSKAGFKRPTPIQQYGIPIILAGRDMMACAQTGSGKTAAFLLPILTSMIKSESLLIAEPGEKQEPVVIVMVPTRELAGQIKDEARKFASGTMAKVVFAYGGVSMAYQMQEIQKGCNILVATPGRALDLISKGRIGLAKCKYLVLDEADRMLEMGFEAEVRKLIQSFDLPTKTDRQTLMFSATFPEDIQNMAQEFLNEHVFVTIGKVGAANQDIKQEVLLVDQYGKKDKVEELIVADLEAFKDEDGSYNKKTLVFVERKRNADFVASFLSQSGVPATSIHGDREQKEREMALRDFKSGACPVLVATAVAARGLDIKGVDHVINYDLPQSIDDYVHRIGRTGRVGNPGRATSFFDADKDAQLAPELVKILTDAQQDVPQFLLEPTVAIGQDGIGIGAVTEEELTTALADLATKEDNW